MSLNYQNARSLVMSAIIAVSLYVLTLNIVVIVITLSSHAE